MVEMITSYCAYFEKIDVGNFFISVLLVVVATSLLKKGLGKMASIAFSVGIYLFMRGVITTGMLMEWWYQVPQFVSTFFLL